MADFDVVSGPYHGLSTVRRCDLGGEPLTEDQPWWLVRSQTRGWEGHHGAGCATHSLREPPRPRPTKGRAPDGYSLATEEWLEQATTATATNPGGDPR